MAKVQKVQKSYAINIGLKPKSPLWKFAWNKWEWERLTQFSKAKIVSTFVEAGISWFPNHFSVGDPGTWDALAYFYNWSLFMCAAGIHTPLSLVWEYSQTLFPYVFLSAKSVTMMGEVLLWVFGAEGPSSTTVKGDSGKRQERLHPDPEGGWWYVCASMHSKSPREKTQGFMPSSFW